MTLTKGFRLGPYEIDSAVGSGGMGEVYRAKDTRLDRTVAIKVLPSRSSWQAEAKIRFEREAKTISGLNHPHICTLYDVGHQEGIDFLVMEFLDGETLATRLQKGKMSTDEAVLIATHIAAALNCAHHKGVVHRDLKPSNVMLTRSGAKVFDFGLAKLQLGAVSGLAEQTDTTPVTGAGAIVGTLQYMSPEQLEGRESDARSDIFAFGVTLYEMLTGQKAFNGTSKASLIGSIMKEQPRPISELMPTMPPALDRLIKKCLHKDPEERWQSAKDLCDELEWIASAGSQAGIAKSVARRRQFHIRISWVLVAGFALLSGALGLELLMRKHLEPNPVQFMVPRSEGVVFMEWPQISPDGHYLAFLGYDSSNVKRIWIRPLASTKATPLPGTEGAQRPFWSPDSKQLAYFDLSATVLKRLPISGGVAQVISHGKGADGSWGRNNVIIFDDYRAGQVGQVSALGGEPKLAAAADSGLGETGTSWPAFLPDGNHFLFCVSADSLANKGKMILKVGSLNGNVTKVLGLVESQALYANPGFLVYVRNDFLTAHPFDLQKLEFIGEPIPLFASISRPNNANGAVNASVSNSGILVWQERLAAVRRLVWFDRAGKRLETIGEPDFYAQVNLSNDNRAVATMVYDRDGKKGKIMISDIQKHSYYPLTSDGGSEWWSVWSPDDEHVAFCSTNDSGVTSLRFCSVNDPTPVTLMSTDSLYMYAYSWHKRDTLSVAVHYVKQMARGDTILPIVVSIPIDMPNHFLGSRQMPANYRDITMLSPDNRFLITWGLPSSDSEIFVHDMSDLRRRWRLAAGGGMPMWSPLGNEIFFLVASDMMVVAVDSRDGFSLGAPKKLFSLYPRPIGYDVSRDGQRFLCIVRDQEQKKSSDEIQVLMNWNAELEESK